MKFFSIHNISLEVLSYVFALNFFYTFYSLFIHTCYYYIDTITSFLLIFGIFNLMVFVNNYFKNKEEKV